jgi:hypothetical protein
MEAGAYHDETRQGLENDVCAQKKENCRAQQGKALKAGAQQGQALQGSVQQGESVFEPFLLRLIFSFELSKQYSHLEVSM